MPVDTAAGSTAGVKVCVWPFPAGFASRSDAAEAESGGAGGREGPVRAEATGHEGTAAVVAQPRPAAATPLTTPAPQTHFSSVEPTRQTLAHRKYK